MITRRELVATLGVAPWAVSGSVLQARRAATGVRAGELGPFPLVEVSGSYREIGYQIGRRLRGRIRAVISLRDWWHRGLLERLGSPAGRALSAELVRLTASRFPHLLDEVRGMAEGAGLAFDAIWAMTIKSELGALQSEPPDCSTLVFRSDDGSRSLLAHNEDGDAAYLDEMVVLRVTPPSGVRFAAMVYPGILTGNGPSLNDRGLVQTTNFIGAVRAAIGLPRYLIGRAILEARDLDEAVQIATTSPRAYPYHHNLASLGDGAYRSVETTPEAIAVRAPRGLFVHTNHLLHGATRGWEDEDQAYRGTSSVSRFEVLSRLVAAADPTTIDPAALMAMLSSHENAPYSPCRHPRGEVTGQTLGTALVDLRAGRFRLYRGNPCSAFQAGRFADLDHLLG